MTVAELIVELQKLPQDAPVVFKCNDVGALDEANSARAFHWIKVYSHGMRQHWYADTDGSCGGPHTDTPTTVVCLNPSEYDRDYHAL